MGTNSTLAHMCAHTQPSLGLFWYMYVQINENMNGKAICLGNILLFSHV